MTSPELTFEESMQRLEEVVAALEGGTLPLDQAMESYQEGVALVRTCRERLWCAASLRMPPEIPSWRKSDESERNLSGNIQAACRSCV